MRELPGSKGLRGYLTVGEAADFLGVSPGTLRNWDRQGKLRPSRHPINGYRLYKRSELQQLVASVQGAGNSARHGRPRTPK
ncbi:MAG: MerR family DNA-binding transcriptional regulator [Phycisphaeraceae bacterium]|nr:MerR family DNA-binding transcriptional regulator [Phycisphaeraceae bacterium]